MRRIKRAQKNQGYAMFTVVLTALVLAAGMAVVWQVTVSSRISTDGAVTDVALVEGCKAGIDLGVAEFWSEYLADEGGTPGNVTSYLTYVDTLLPNDGSELDLLASLNGGLPRDLPGGVQIAALTATRTDEADGATIQFAVTTTQGARQRTASQTVRIGGEQQSHAEFALMANNVNCILCHAQVRSLPMGTNSDDTQYNTFERLKVASLESLLVPNLHIGSLNFTAMSEIEGTIYTRGSVADHNGDPIDTATILAAELTSVNLNADGTITQDPITGATTQVPFSIAGVDGEGLPIPNENLYLNYPTDEADMTDGELPTSFPTPFSDEDGDRIISDSEFQPFIDGAHGSISGGIIHGTPTGSAYGGAALPGSSNGAASDLANGNYDGNLILVGTDTNPIDISGNVVVDGDVVIQGLVRGLGEITARGNVYVTGDVTYANGVDGGGNETFGVASDGTLNGLSVEAGGNILMGDYLTRSAVENPNRSAIQHQGLVQVREATDVVQLPGGAWVDRGYFANNMTDEGQSTNGEGWMSFTSVELAMFNATEVEHAIADPSYIPRLYTLNDSAPAWEWLGNDITSKHYDEPDFAHVPQAILDRAVIESMEPDQSWISTDTLRQIWFNDEASRSNSGEPFQFDGLLYTNNAIFGITRNELWHGSNTDGEMLVRGAIIAPDLGLLVPGRNFSDDRDGFVLQYDPRVQQFVNIVDNSVIELNRLVYLNES